MPVTPEDAKLFDAVLQYATETGTQHAAFGQGITADDGREFVLTLMFAITDEAKSLQLRDALAETMPRILGAPDEATGAGPIITSNGDLGL